MSTESNELAGQVAVISGGLGDIGRAIAQTLAHRGADIAIGDVLDPNDAEPFVTKLRQSGRRARYDRADVTDAQSVVRWIQAVEEDLGVPTLIVPNAAIVTPADFHTITAEQWSRELRVNLDGAFHLAQESVRRLRAAGHPGRIVFVGSWAAHRPHPQIPAYCVAKAGMRMLCQVMALDLAPHGILVNEVAPGYVDAGLTGKAWAAHPEQRDAGRRRIPTQQLITPEEVALQVAHLCSPWNRHMTGTMILMDGGLSLTNASPPSTQSSETA